VESWFVVPNVGLLYGAGLFCLSVVSAVLAIGGAFVREGRGPLFAAFLLELIALVFALVDQFFLFVGVSGTSGAIWGGGMYLLFTTVVLLAIGWRTQPMAAKKEND
jgi:hypothetical protein